MTQRCRGCHPGQPGSGVPPRWGGRGVSACATSDGLARGGSSLDDLQQGCHAPWLLEAECSYSARTSRDRDAARGDITGFCDFKTTIRTSSPSLLLVLLITSILSSILPEVTVYKPPPAACPL